MANPVMMKNSETGLSKTGYYGFSWTTLFFGPFPALFRSDFLTFLGYFAVSVVLAYTTFYIGNIVAGVVWAFMYNRYYTRRLIERGYRFADRAEVVTWASAAVGVAMPGSTAKPERNEPHFNQIQKKFMYDGKTYTIMGQGEGGKFLVDIDGKRSFEDLESLNNKFLRGTPLN